MRGRLALLEALYRSVNHTRIFSYDDRIFYTKFLQENPWKRKKRLIKRKQVK